jgi:hypothetical protein
MFSWLICFSVTNTWKLLFNLGLLIGGQVVAVRFVPVSHLISAIWSQLWSLKLLFLFYHFQMVTAVYSAFFKVGSRRFVREQRRLFAKSILLRPKNVWTLTSMSLYATMICVVPSNGISVEWSDLVLRTPVPKVPTSRMDPELYYLK